MVGFNYIDWARHRLATPCSIRYESHTQNYCHESALPWHNVQVKAGMLLAQCVLRPGYAVVRPEGSTEKSLQNVGADLVPRIIICAFQKSVELKKSNVPIPVSHPQDIW